jgi:serine/threonine protein kinase
LLRERKTARVTAWSKEAMSTKIGHFEILSELAKSPTGTVYKANDPESNQTIALKAIQLSAFGDHADALEHALLAEAESTNVLSSPNISKIFGAGEMEGQFCAAMEYVQGNSIATMLARKEGFSIWDLLDIGRQLTSGLDHSTSLKLVHYSLEPSKIMCGWDGTVKILSFGVSSVGKFAQHLSQGLPSFLHYMSPEQVRGEDTDGRSNLYSLGAMFYEMVTERKAFDREDIESLRQSILESIPVAPLHVNSKIHPLLSNLIMKALEKDPAKRYQSGREMLDDLEKCKESKPAAAKKAEAPKGIAVPDKAKTAAQSKFVNAGQPKPPAPVAPPKPASAPSGLARPSAPPAPRSSALAKPSKLAMPKAAAAAAGVGSSDSVALPEMNAAPAEIQELDLSDQYVASAPQIDVEPEPSSYMSAAVADEPEVETFEPQSDHATPKIAVDPMMAEGRPAGGGGGTSFSEISELPPLKEVYVAPPPPPPVETAPVQSEMAAVAPFRGGRKADEKPKVQPRVVAQKAIKEIKGVPPKLYLYALGGAGLLILLIAVGVTYYIHGQGDDDAGAPRSTAVSESPAQPAPAVPAPKTEAAPAPAPAQPEEVQEPDTPVAQTATPSRSRGAKKKATTAPVVIPGQLVLDSTPQGAQVQIDGATDPSWVTPFTLTNIQPGQHTITVSKSGYATDTRTVSITSANRATTQIHLAQLVATLLVKSTPPGASVYVDGHNMNAKTPAQVSVDKGQHLVLVRMSGYLDETMNGQFMLGQTLNFSPTLQPLGNVDSIKTVGSKMSRLFGGKGQPGQATISIHTQPKGAEIAVNQRMLDKPAPVDVMVDPGNYVIDITLSGYAPIHKVITATKSGKVVIDEALQPQ